MRLRRKSLCGKSATVFPLTGSAGSLAGAGMLRIAGAPVAPVIFNTGTATGFNCRLAATTGWALPGANVKEGQRPPTAAVCFGVIADPHLFETRLGTSGSAFEN